ncbi:MAG: hypothetical protein ABJB97_07605 [Acidobacteriota bacterium]
MQCRELREIADSYLSGELIVETNHDVISHLEQCNDCRRELAARRELNSRLRALFVNAPENQMRPEFADRLGIQLHEHALGKRSAPVARKQRILWLALAACLLLATGLGLVVIRPRMSPQPSFQEVAEYDPTRTYSPELNQGTPVSLLKTEFTRSAAGDHRDCAIHFRLAEKPIDLEVAGRKFDPVYINLTNVVLSQGGMPRDAKLVEAHSCVFEGRRFAHIILKYHGHLVSLLVTETSPNRETKGAPQTLAQQQVIACSQFDGYRVSCFQTTRHAVFVVSDLPEGENLLLARAIAPSLYAHVTRTEKAA